MITPEIIRYIKQQIALGISREQISVSLKQNGWNDADVAEAFAAISSSPTSSIPHAPQPLVRPSHKVRNIVISIVILALLGGAGWWWFYGRKMAPAVQEEPVKSSASVQIPKAENFEDFKINYVKVPTEENSASIFNALPTDAVAKADKDLMDKYLKDFPGIGSISLSESKKILAKYKNLLTVFESGVGKRYYQCSIIMGENCFLNSLRGVSSLAVLQSFVLFKESKVIDSQNYAQKIIKLGQMLTEQSDDFLTLLVGWEIQKKGYYALRETKPITGLSADDKNILINNLRKEHKKAFQFDYVMHIETIDYITDVNKKPSGLVDKDAEDFFAEYRKAANSKTWKPEIVKRWFYDSYKITLASVDLPCGSVYKDSLVDIGFNPDDTTQTENYIGKTLYSTTYASLNTTSLKRCELENLINSL